MRITLCGLHYQTYDASQYKIPPPPSYVCSSSGSQKASVLTFPPCVFVQHEKYTSQLQLSIKALEAKAKEKQQLHSLDKIKGPVTNVKVLDRAERRANSLTGTQLHPLE